MQQDHSIADINKITFQNGYVVIQTKKAVDFINGFFSSVEVNGRRIELFD